MSQTRVTDYLVSRLQDITIFRHYDFQTVKNQYQFLPTRENLVPTRHIFRTLNIPRSVRNRHEVKFMSIMLTCIPGIDKIPSPHKPAVVCIHFQNKRGTIFDQVKTS